jgi:hypothetical protein
LFANNEKRILMAAILLPVTKMVISRAFPTGREEGFHASSASAACVLLFFRV